MEKGLASFAGTSMTYVGDENFRLRKTGDGNFRVHVNKDVVRDRENYVAFDLPADTIAQAVNAAYFEG